MLNFCNMLVDADHLFVSCFLARYLKEAYWKELRGHTKQFRTMQQRRMQHWQIVMQLLLVLKACRRKLKITQARVALVTMMSAIG
jgi:hypothetical protein